MKTTTSKTNSASSTVRTLDRSKLFGYSQLSKVIKSNDSDSANHFSKIGELVPPAPANYFSKIGEALPPAPANFVL
jgi:hypothetical protein